MKNFYLKDLIFCVFLLNAVFGVIQKDIKLGETYKGTITDDQSTILKFSLNLSETQNLFLESRVSG
jgi:hypothetical protein